MAKPKVLLIEDDRSLTEVLRYNLDQSGYQVFVAHDGQDGIAQAQSKLPDIILLDLMLPVIDGLDVCRRLKNDPLTKNALIVMLTAKSEEHDEIIGLKLGADAYVTKPYSVKVLLERINALRRLQTNEGAEEDDVSICQGICVDRVRHRVLAEGLPIELTRSEFNLLDTLIRQPGRVFQRSELIDSALGEDTMVMERTIDVHIRALRRKMDRYADLIETVRGVGYRFRDTALATEEVV